MTANFVESSDLDDHIKLLLTCVEWFERVGFNTSNEISQCFTKGNLLSLLNLPSQIERFGKLRLLWEGNRERYISTMRPFLKQMRKKPTFLKTKLTHLTQKQGLEHLMQTVPLASESQYDRYQNVRIYSGVTEIEERIQSGKPLSAVCIKPQEQHEKLVVCIKREHQQITICDMTMHDIQGEVKCGTWYTTISIDVSEDDDSSGTFESLLKLVVCFAHLLPGDKNESDEYQYCIITDNWTERQRDGQYTLPDIERSLFTPAWT